MSSVEEEQSWVEWYCGFSQNKYFCEVDRSYMEDSFNLCGLKEIVPDFRDSHNIILDKLDPPDDEVPGSCIELYGLIHARFIITSRGMEKMRIKYLKGDFGVCPRDACDRQLVLPIGLYDDVRNKTVRLYCGKCKDIYLPTTKMNVSVNIDGAYFGSTFAHLFYMTFPQLMPESTVNSKRVYAPRVFGYRVSTKKRQENNGSSLPKQDNNKENGKEKDSKKHDNSSLIKQQATATATATMAATAITNSTTTSVKENNTKRRRQ